MVGGEEYTSTARQWVRTAAMIRDSVFIIQDRVDAEIRRGEVIDVYRLASALKGDCGDLSNEAIAKVVSEAVILGHGNAVWNRHPLN